MRFAEVFAHHSTLPPHIFNWSQTIDSAMGVTVSTRSIHMRLIVMCHDPCVLQYEIQEVRRWSRTTFFVPYKHHPIPSFTRHSHGSAHYSQRAILWIASLDLNHHGDPHRKKGFKTTVSIVSTNVFQKVATIRHSCSTTPPPPPETDIA